MCKDFLFLPCHIKDLKDISPYFATKTAITANYQIFLDVIGY
jgi:hypothetical protein